MHLGLSWAAYLRAALVRNWLVELDWLEEAAAHLRLGSGAAGGQGRWDLLGAWAGFVTGAQGHC